MKDVLLVKFLVQNVPGHKYKMAIDVWSILVRIFDTIFVTRPATIKHVSTKNCQFFVFPLS